VYIVPDSVKKHATNALSACEDRFPALEGVTGHSVAKKLSEGRVGLQTVSRMHRFFQAAEEDYAQALSELLTEEVSPVVRSWSLHGAEPGKAWAARLYAEASAQGLVDEDRVGALYGLEPEQVCERFQAEAWRWDYGFDLPTAARFVDLYEQHTGHTLDFEAAFGESAEAVENGVIRRRHKPDVYEVVQGILSNTSDADYKEAALQDLNDMNESIYPKAGKEQYGTSKKYLWEIWGTMMAYFVLAVEDRAYLKIGGVNSESKPPPSYQDIGTKRNPLHYNDPINIYLAYFHPDGQFYSVPSGMNQTQVDKLVKLTYDMYRAAYLGQNMEAPAVWSALKKLKKWIQKRKLSGGPFNTLIKAWEKGDWQTILTTLSVASDMYTTFSEWVKTNPKPKEGYKLQQSAGGKQIEKQVKAYVAQSDDPELDGLEDVKFVPVGSTEFGELCQEAGTDVGIGSVLEDADGNQVTVTTVFQDVDGDPVFLLTQATTGKNLAVWDDQIVDMWEEDTIEVVQGHIDMPWTNYKKKEAQDTVAGEEEEGEEPEAITTKSVPASVEQGIKQTVGVPPESIEPYPLAKTEFVQTAIEGGDTADEGSLWLHTPTNAIWRLEGAYKTKPSETVFVAFNQSDPVPYYDDVVTGYYTTEKLKEVARGEKAPKIDGSVDLDTLKALLGAGDAANKTITQIGLEDTAFYKALSAEHQSDEILNGVWVEENNKKVFLGSAYRVQYLAEELTTYISLTDDAGEFYRVASEAVLAGLYADAKFQPFVPEVEKPDLDAGVKLEFAAQYANQVALADISAYPLKDTKTAQEAGVETFVEGSNWLFYDDPVTVVQALNYQTSEVMIALKHVAGNYEFVSDVVALTAYNDGALTPFEGPLPEPESDFMYKKFDVLEKANGDGYAIVVNDPLPVHGCHVVFLSASSMSKPPKVYTYNLSTVEKQFLAKPVDHIPVTFARLSDLVNYIETKNIDPIDTPTDAPFAVGDAVNLSIDGNTGLYEVLGYGKSTKTNTTQAILGTTAWTEYKTKNTTAEAKIFVLKVVPVLALEKGAAPAANYAPVAPKPEPGAEDSVAFSPSVTQKGLNYAKNATWWDFEYTFEAQDANIAYKYPIGTLLESATGKVYSILGYAKVDGKPHYMAQEPDTGIIFFASCVSSNTDKIAGFSKEIASDAIPAPGSDAQTMKTDPEMCGTPEAQEYVQKKSSSLGLASKSMSGDFIYNIGDVVRTKGGLGDGLTILGYALTNNSTPYYITSLKSTGLITGQHAKSLNENHEVYSFDGTVAANAQPLPKTAVEGTKTPDDVFGTAVALKAFANLSPDKGKHYLPATKGESEAFTLDIGTLLEPLTGSFTEIVVHGYAFGPDGTTPHYFVALRPDEIYGAYAAVNLNKAPVLGFDPDVAETLYSKPGKSGFPTLSYSLSKVAKAWSKHTGNVFIDAPGDAPFFVNTKIKRVATGTSHRLLGWVLGTGSGGNLAGVLVPAKTKTYTPKKEDVGTVDMSSLADKNEWTIAYSGDTDIDTDTGEVTFGKKAGSAELTVTVPGTNVTLPSDLPKGYDQPTPVQQPQVKTPSKGHLSAGVVAVVPAGTTFSGKGKLFTSPVPCFVMVHPMNEFGGYTLTFPKGTVDEGEGFTKAAVREVREETGLAVRPVAYLGDYHSGSSVSRFFIGDIKGGKPHGAGKETDSVLIKPILPKAAAQTQKWWKKLTDRDKKIYVDASKWVAKHGWPQDNEVKAAETDAAPTVSEVNDPANKGITAPRGKPNYSVKPDLQAWCSGHYKTVDWSFLSSQNMTGQGLPEIGSMVNHSELPKASKLVAYVHYVVKGTEAEHVNPIFEVPSEEGGYYAVADTDPDNFEVSTEGAALVTTAPYTLSQKDADAVTDALSDLVPDSMSTFEWVDVPEGYPPVGFDVTFAPSHIEVSKVVGYFRYRDELKHMIYGIGFAESSEVLAYTLSLYEKDVDDDEVLKVFRDPGAFKLVGSDAVEPEQTKEEQEPVIGPPANPAIQKAIVDSNVFINDISELKFIPSPEGYPKVDDVFKTEVGGDDVFTVLGYVEEPKPREIVSMISKVGIAIEWFTIYDEEGMVVKYPSDFILVGKKETTPKQVETAPPSTDGVSDMVQTLAWTAGVPLPPEALKVLNAAVGTDTTAIKYEPGDYYGKLVRLYDADGDVLTGSDPSVSLGRFILTTAEGEERVGEYVANTKINPSQPPYHVWFNVAKIELLEEGQEQQYQYETAKYTTGSSVKDKAMSAWATTGKLNVPLKTFQTWCADSGIEGYETITKDMAPKVAKLFTNKVTPGEVKAVENWLKHVADLKTKGALQGVAADPEFDTTSKAAKKIKLKSPLSPDLHNKLLTLNPNTLTETGEASPGGSKPNTILVDEEGNKYFFKTAPTSAEDFRPYVDAAAFELAEAVKGNNVPVRVVNADMHGTKRLGSLQPFVEPDNPPPANPESLSDDNKAELLAQHAFDMFVGDHDGHSGNWLMKGGKLIPIDRGQAFKFIIKGALQGQSSGESLKPDFHPAGNFGQGYAKQLLKSWGMEEAEIPTLAWKAMRRVIANIQGMTDGFLRSKIDPVLEKKGLTESQTEAVYNELFSRRDKYLANWTKVLKNLRADFKWPSVGEVEWLAPLPGIGDLGDSVEAVGFTEKEAKIIEEAKNSGWRGKSVQIDRDVIEEQAVMVRKVQMRTAKGDVVDATLIHFRISHDAGMRLTGKLLPEANLVHVKASDATDKIDALKIDVLKGYWKAIRVAVGNINYHLAVANDKNLNESKVSPVVSTPLTHTAGKNLKSDLIDLQEEAVAKLEEKHPETGDKYSDIAKMCDSYIDYCEKMESVVGDMDTYLGKGIKEHFYQWEKPPEEEEEEEEVVEEVPEEKPFNVTFKGAGAEWPNCNVADGVIEADETGVQFKKEIEDAYGKKHWAAGGNKAMFNATSHSQFVLEDKTTQARLYITPPGETPWSEVMADLRGHRGQCWGLIPGEPSPETVARLLHLVQDLTEMPMTPATSEDEEVLFLAKQLVVLQDKGKSWQPKAVAGHIYAGGVVSAEVEEEFAEAMDAYREGDTEKALSLLRKRVAAKLADKYPDVTEETLDQLPGWLPEGEYDGKDAGWNVKARLGVTRDDVVEVFPSNTFVAHRPLKGNAGDVLYLMLVNNGALLSNNTKPYYGLDPFGKPGKEPSGGSVGSDFASGGTQGIFATFRTGLTGGDIGAFYFDLSVLLRTDVFVTWFDDFGNEGAPRITDFERMVEAGHHWGWTGEICAATKPQVNVRHSLDLMKYLHTAVIGPYTSHTVEELVELAYEKGFTHFFNGRKPEKVIVKTNDEGNP
jgi:8-oxo-dGTP pyrophosphatase MutT (NUDIX family)